MAKIFKPRRGKKSTMAGTKKATVLSAGEMFIEVPDTGAGTGHSKMKIGDGSTQYSSLPYAMGDTENDKIAFSNDTSGNITTALNKVTSGAALKTMIAALKQAVSLANTSITQLNDECDSIKQSFQDGCNIIINKIQSIGVTPSSNSPTAIANAIQEIRDGSLEAGRQQVTGNPNKYNLFTAEQYNQNYNNGRTQGQNDVKGNPNAYGLYSKSQYDNHYNEGYNAGYNAGVSAGQGSVAGSYNISFTINARGGDNGSNWMKYTDQITINVSKSGVPTLGSPSFMNAQIRSEYGESYRLTKK